MRDPDEPSRRVDQPEPGLFELRLVRGGPLVVGRISFEDGLWSAEIDGLPQGPPDPDPAVARGVYRLWHGARRIGESLYGYRVAMKSWARAHSPGHPTLRPDKPVDLRLHASLF